MTEHAIHIHRHVEHNWQADIGDIHYTVLGPAAMPNRIGWDVQWIDVTDEFGHGQHETGQWLKDAWENAHDTNPDHGIPLEAIYAAFEQAVSDDCDGPEHDMVDEVEELEDPRVGMFW